MMDATLNVNRKVAWTERRDQAANLVELLASGGAGDADLTRLKELAADPKWEVRGEVAKALVFLPQPLFDELSAVMVEDSNSFVRRAAQRACDSRRLSERQAAQVCRAADDIERQLEVMAQRMGEPAARQAQRIRDRYAELIAGSMVHDLRSVLSALSSACANLINEGNRRRVYAVRVRENLDLLSRILSDAESFMRSLPVDRHPERLAGVVADAVQMATDNVRANGIDPAPVEVTTDVAANIAIPMARRLIVMALTNLIKNAIESFSSQPRELRPGSVAISATPSGDGVLIQIRDSGSGMTQQELAECRRLLPGRRNKSKRFSTGYGMLIAARNIAGHGGSMEIESQEGEGTRISIYLPKVSGEAKP